MRLRWALLPFMKTLVCVVSRGSIEQRGEELKGILEGFKQQMKDGSETFPANQNNSLGSNLVQVVHLAATFSVHGLEAAD